MKVTIPEELKDRITSLSEEQELMIIVSDEEKIKADPILGKLDKKQLRLLLSTNSLKSLKHSLICLLGTKTLENNKEIHLSNFMRRRIIDSIKSKLYDADAKTLKERYAFRVYIATPIQGTHRKDRLDYGDKIIEEEVSKASVSDAFPRGRYGIFDGFVSNVNWISSLAISIREQIKHQYPNMIEILKSKNEQFGKFIYPDEETFISIEDARGEKTEYEMVPAISLIDGKTEVMWNAARIIETDEDQEMLNVLKKWDKDARVSHKKIYFEDAESGNSFITRYVQDGQKKQIKLINGRLYEILPEQINKDEIRDDNKER